MMTTLTEMYFVKTIWRYLKRKGLNFPWKLSIIEEKQGKLARRSETLGLRNFASKGKQRERDIRILLENGRRKRLREHTIFIHNHLNRTIIDAFFMTLILIVMDTLFL